MPHPSGRTIRVLPMPDGEADGRTRWQVQVSGSRESTHRKKSAAKRMADREAKKGDDIYIHGEGGEVLRERTKGVRGPRGDY